MTLTSGDGFLGEEFRPVFLVDNGINGSVTWHDALVGLVWVFRLVGFGLRRQGLSR